MGIDKKETSWWEKKDTQLEEAERIWKENPNTRKRPQTRYHETLIPQIKGDRLKEAKHRGAIVCLSKVSFPFLFHVWLIEVVKEVSEGSDRKANGGEIERALWDWERERDIESDGGAMESRVRDNEDDECLLRFFLFLQFIIKQNK